MSDVKCARLMYRAAERDVLTLRSMTADTPAESFGFHVQQAAEKALKAWLALLGETYPLTHSIEMLLNLLANRNASVEPFRHLADYTPYAVELRYAGVDPDAEPIDREGALALVETLLERVGGELAEAGCA
jgi:HEPN domain-containing protein